MELSKIDELIYKCGNMVGFNKKYNKTTRKERCFSRK